ncbi:MAG TPA: 2-C-methyl-D-erythritol 4-phosphate cytidylyltransferase [Edaphocola sp.]|nr:2-C-methyl-D-erythritol 4-phosphate cytidylyltransferase [Edaphocola sp.]
MIENINNRCVAVIVAGGQGLRMNNAMPKQFLPIHGQPVLYHTIKAFLNAIPDIKIVLVLPIGHLSYANMVLQLFPDGIDLTIVTGGNNRFESVKNGLGAVNDNDVVFVHDGVRPMISEALIKRCLEGALLNGSAIPAIPVEKVVRKLHSDFSEVVDSSLLRIVQSPQTFKGKVLLSAFEQKFQESFIDEASVVEHSGVKIYIVEGETRNLRIINEEDLIIAEALMRK